MKALKGMLLLITSLGLLGTAYGVESASGSYKVLQKVSLPGDGGWDYVKCDSDNRRLYVSHDTQVLVLDVDSLKIIGKVDGLKRAHGVALVPDLNRGFATSGGTTSVVVFDLKTFKTIAEIKTDEDPDAILYDPASGHIFVFNGDAGLSTVIDPSTAKIIGKIDLGGSPEYAAADGKGFIFNNLEDKSQIVKIDTKSLKVTFRWDLKPGESPAALAIDPVNNRVFSGCHNQLEVVLDTTNGKVIATLPIGGRVDAGWFDAASGTAFSSNGDGTLTVIHEDSPDHFSVVETVKTEPGSRTMAYDAKTDRVFLPTAKFLPTPMPTKNNPKPRGQMVPGTFGLLVVGK
jgi:DNA-binding beta-propeller fold protein YncE